jgi:capsule polysaccharide modification protein KpsS
MLRAGCRKPVDLDNDLTKALISFHCKTYQYFGQERDEDLAAIAHGYISFLEELFRKRRFDRAIVFGSSRLLPKAVVHIARKHHVPVFFFEQAPFGRTILNPGGVGSKMVLPPYQKHEGSNSEKIRVHGGRSAKSHYWKSEKKSMALRLAQAHTLLQSFQPKLLQTFLAPDLYTGPFSLLLKRTLAKIRVKHAKKPAVPTSVGRRISLFLQTPVDAQFFEESPVYGDFTQMVEDVISACPQSHRLVVREHPEHLGCYSPKLYDLIDASPNAILDNLTPFDELLKGSELVIVNNSTVGFQALAIGKKVLVLGNAFYSGKGITYDLSDRTEMSTILRRALREPSKPDCAQEFVAYMLNEVFFSGYFQDLDLEFDERLIALVVDGE